MKRSTLLPVAMVIVIVVLTLIVISSNRSNAPDVAGDATYPHYVCTFNDYCEGDSCSREPQSFVVYLRHEDGLPRLELPRFNTRATIIEFPDGLKFESTGGEVSGVLTVFRDRGLDLVASSGEGANLVEHYASGRCDRLITP